MTGVYHLRIMGVGVIDMPTKGNPAICIRLTADQIARLKRIAAEQGTTTTQLVRDAINFYLLKTTKQP